MSLRRGVITGIGAVTPAGIGWKRNWHAALNGLSGIRPITLFPAKGYRTTVAGEVRDFDPRPFINDKLMAASERFTQFAIGAARLAVDDSGMVLSAGYPEIGVVIGCGMGGLPYFEIQADVYAKKGPGFIRPGSVPRIMPNAAASYIASLWRLRGANSTISTACSSSNHAVGVALDLIRLGRITTDTLQENYIFCAAIFCGYVIDIRD